MLRGDSFSTAIASPLALPVKPIDLEAYRFGYEWDFLYRDRGFVGLLLETKYTDIKATLTQLAALESSSSHARAPIPAIGVIGRGYVLPNISITGEFSVLQAAPPASTRTTAASISTSTSTAP